MEPQLRTAKLIARGLQSGHVLRDLLLASPATMRELLRRNATAACAAAGAVFEEEPAGATGGRGDPSVAPSVSATAGWRLPMTCADALPVVDLLLGSRNYDGHARAGGGGRVEVYRSLQPLCSGVEALLGSLHDFCRKACGMTRRLSMHFVDW